MNQPDSFFAAQLTTPQQLKDFWVLAKDWGYSGESAFCKIKFEGCKNVKFPLVTMQKAG
jgi:hypothetical protein